jgi:hypothetical protein
MTELRFPAIETSRPTLLPTHPMGIRESSPGGKVSSLRVSVITVRYFVKHKDSFTFTLSFLCWTVPFTRHLFAFSHDKVQFPLKSTHERFVLSRGDRSISLTCDINLHSKTSQDRKFMLEGALYQVFSIGSVKWHCINYGGYSAPVTSLVVAKYEQWVTNTTMETWLSMKHKTGLETWLTWQLTIRIHSLSPMCPCEFDNYIHYISYSHTKKPSAEVNNEWSYTSTPPIRLHGVVLSYGTEYS